LIGLSPIHSGSVHFAGEELAQLKGSAWNRIRRHAQLIFQDPFASLNPRHTAGNIITEPMLIHGLLRGNDRKQEALRLMDMVQLPADAVDRYPHQFSGGQRQRIGIARALSLQPELLICDESVSALDVSVQAQILNLLKELQARLNLSYLFISHDLSVVHYMSDEIAVMRQGRIVEQAEAGELMARPGNDYTRKLIAAIPGNGRVSG
jgi:peptide/nickel transport system ATP-binding protein